MTGTAARRWPRSWPSGSSSEGTWVHMAEVLVLAEHSGGEVKKVTCELLTAARRLGSPSAVWTGPGAGAGQAAGRPCAGPLGQPAPVRRQRGDPGDNGGRVQPDQEPAGQVAGVHERPSVGLTLATTLRPPSAAGRRHREPT